ncbi:MAG: T9SS type A sorting domain-containing protein [Flavobacteriales bacterium]
MYRSFLVAGSLAIAFVSNAQSYVHQVMVLNEGYYDFAGGEQVVPVTLGSYDPVSGGYETVATIAGARYGNQVSVDGSNIYVGADSFLLKYDADTYVLLDQEVVVGVRAFAFWNDQMIITRGEIGGLSHYVEVRDKNTFDLLYSVPTIDLPYSCEDVEVVGDVAYIAVGNAFEWGNTVGMLGKLDLTTGSWGGSVDLGPDGQNPENVMVRGDAIYTLNNRDFSSSSVSKVNGVGEGGTSAALAFTTTVTAGGGCAASELMSNGRIYYMEYAQDQMARFDVSIDAVSDTLSGSIVPYGIVENPIDQVMYATTTDYVSTGDLHVLAYDGTVLGTTPVGVAAGSLALDVRLSTGVTPTSGDGLVLYPNPATSEVFVQLPGIGGKAPVIITDATGRIVREEVLSLNLMQRLDVDGFAPGLYTLQVRGTSVARFAKQ